MGLSPNRREIGEKARKNQGLLGDNRSPTKLTESSHCDHESQVAENKGDNEHRLGAVRVCKTICRPT
jgi:hypothetical protein